MISGVSAIMRGMNQDDKILRFLLIILFNNNKNIFFRSKLRDINHYMQKKNINFNLQS